MQVRQEEAARKPEKTERKPVAGGSGTMWGREDLRVGWRQRPDCSVRKNFRGEVVKSYRLREFSGKDRRGAQVSHV